MKEMEIIWRMTRESAHYMSENITQEMRYNQLDAQTKKYFQNCLLS
jgi:hypothetical protein